MITSTKAKYIRHLIDKGYRIINQNLVAMGSLLFDVQETSNSTAMGTQNGFCRKLNPASDLNLCPAPYHATGKANEPQTPAEKRVAKVRAHMAAVNQKWAELKAQGYRSGGYDFDTDSTAIVKGTYPNGKIVGYLNRDLTVTWKETT